MDGAEQAGFIWIIVNWQEVDLNLVSLEDDCRSTDNDLPYTACAQTAADHEPPGILPRLELQKPSNDERKILEKILLSHLEPNRQPQDHRG